MKILFKYPTYKRPDWFKQTLEKYYEMLSEKCLYEFVISLDEDDKTMNNPEMKVFMNSKPRLSYYYGKHCSKVQAINANMEEVSDWDILILVSDDMIPIVKDFDEIVVKKMEKHFPNTDGALHFNDGLFGQDKTITLTIMGRKLYERFDYIYHPAYKSFFCDNEFTDVVRKLNKVIYFPQVIIRHDWRGGQKADATYKRNTKLGGDDEKIYNRRKLLGFPNNKWS